MRRTSTVLALAALLLLGACRSETAGVSPTPSAVPVELAVALSDFKIEPTSLTADGTLISIAVSNAGPTPHNLTIRDASETVVLATDDLRRDTSTTLDGELAPGSYTLFCALAGHESLGMRASLVVTAP